MNVWGLGLWFEQNVLRSMQNLCSHWLIELNLPKILLMNQFLLFIL